jgi:hypothetical protein
MDQVRDPIKQLREGWWGSACQPADGPKRARLGSGATTALLDRLEDKELARRNRDTEDRRRVLVEVMSPDPDGQLRIRTGDAGAAGTLD